MAVQHVHFQCGPGAVADMWVDGRIAEYDVPNDDIAFAAALRRRRIPKDAEVFVTPMGEPKQPWSAGRLRR